ncbi:hypothetical protein LU290_08955 [Moraxella nasibovis]|uniref:hypothetical protein n=1 Tax=Moraxella nasibovis TaxID=2904120 RepID=UPI00241000A2|nr:hypothetical protein [Moraxella nasibovis]WFF38365.1 hypothetical protein LU290_08955 [Moraxella nasibovis]
MIDIAKVTQHFKKPELYLSNSFLKIYCANEITNCDSGHIIYCQMNCHYFDLETNIYLILKSCENFLQSSPTWFDYYRFKEGYPLKLSNYINEAIQEIQSSENQTNNHHLLQQILKGQLEKLNGVAKIYTFELNREKFRSAILDQIQDPIDGLSKLIFWIDKDENIHFLWVRESR